MTDMEIQTADEAPSPPPTGAGTGLVGPAGGALRWFRQGNTPLAVMFIAAMVGVYLLSLRQGPATASAQVQAADGQVETVLAEWQARRAVAEHSVSATDLVNTFYYEMRQRQVPPEKLGGNPFEFRPPAGAPTGPAPAAAEPPAVDDNGHGDALSALKELQLQLVLAGPHGATAMISNNILTEGQVIRGWTIIKITPETVVLQWQDQTVELKMHQTELH